MPRRVDVDPSLAPAVVPGRILNELYQHALETLPEECCGLIVGRAAEPFGRVVRCRNEMTRRHRMDPERWPRDGREAFYMNESDYQKAQEEAEAGGQRVTGIYHSHVGAGVYLSEEDLAHAEHELFPFPEADHLVVAVIESRVGGVGLFRRHGSGGGFVGRRVLPAAGTP